MNASTQNTQWQSVCSLEDLVPNSGIAALLPIQEQISEHKNQQVALFWLPSEDTIFALDNYDPLSDTYLNARGLIGDIDGEPMLATPLYKHHYRLTDGQCLEDDSVNLKIWPVKVEDNKVMILA